MAPGLKLDLEGRVSCAAAKEKGRGSPNILLEPTEAGSPLPGGWLNGRPAHQHHPTKHPHHRRHLARSPRSLVGSGSVPGTGAPPVWKEWLFRSTREDSRSRFSRYSNFALFLKRTLRRECSRAGKKRATASRLSGVRSRDRSRSVLGGR